MTPDNPRPQGGGRYYERRGAAAGQGAGARALVDRFGRRVVYLRLSVTDRCDLRCRYCLPMGAQGFASRSDWLAFGEIERLVRAFARLGVSRVRLTGGEPLLRRGLPDLAARLLAIPGIEDISLSTNGTQLARHALALRQAGVSRINVSLDSLRRERFARITGHDALDRVIDGLLTAKTAGFTPIKINTVALPGINDDELEDLVRFCFEHGFLLRLIEAMPVGETGRSAGYLDLQPVRRRLKKRFGLIDGVAPGAGPARYLQSPDGRLAVGFITPISQHFCAACNRVRLAVDGRLYPCLGQEASFELRPLLRSGAGDEALESAICGAIARKPERHEFREAPARIVLFMSATGG